MPGPPATRRQTALHRWVYRGTRPGAGWHAHGTTPRTLTLLSGAGLARLTVHKQRWKEVATGRTCHSRPGWEAAWSSFGLCVVMTLVGLWLTASEGLHRLSWPWPRDRPARRTLQRWMRLLRPDAQTWMQAIRLAAIDLTSPRPLDEIVPVEGIPPPGQGARRRTQSPSQDSHLAEGIGILNEVARQESIEIRTVLAEAKARWPGSSPTSPTVPRP